MRWSSLLVLVFFACSSESSPADEGNSSSGGAGGSSSGSSGATSSGGGGASSSSGGEISPYERFVESVQAGGRAHDYVVMVPREPTAAKLPIVFVYHGDGGSSDSLQRSWQVERAAGQSAVVVYPNSPGGWNVPEQSQANVFIAGFDAIRAKVAQEHGGDEGDVSALGWSNGGFFTQILGCWRGASLHTIGAMAGSYPYDKQSTGGEWPNEFPKCEGQTPVPALIMHGANDGVGNGKLSAVYWTYVNRCSANPDGCAVTDNTTPTARPPCVRFNDAPATDPVELCEIPGMGHQIWDQSAAAMWDFIQAAPK